jgi:prepilin-type N-terminal cleavage/methylation domain-containing protein
MKERRNRKSEKGFTLVETMIALAVMAVGVLGLAAMLADSLAYMNGAEADFIAQQKAQQCVEAIFTAKYDSRITWPQVANNGVGNPLGLFYSTAQLIRQPGADGLVNSINDTTAPLDYVLYPGPDGKLGTADDVQVLLSNYTRTVTITNFHGDPNLRTVQVTVNYTAGKFQRIYTLNTLISAFD